MTTRAHGTEITKLRSEIDDLRSQLLNLDKKSSLSAPSSSSSAVSKKPSGGKGRLSELGVDSWAEGEQRGGSGSGSSHLDNNSSSSSSSTTMAMPGTLPSGEISYAGARRMEQQQQQRAEGQRGAEAQISQLQAARDALLREVTFLSSRNAQLEEEAASVPRLREEMFANRKRSDCLLALLGEKEEEVEAALADMREVKSLYRGQMNDLLARIAPPPPDMPELR